MKYSLISYNKDSATQGLMPPYFLNVGATLVVAHGYHKQNLHYPWATTRVAPTL
jgi:hypothetical protein